MFEFWKRRSAKRELDLALTGLLLGDDKTQAALKQHCKDKWPGFVEDVMKGAKPFDEAANLVALYLLEILGRDATPEQLKELAEAILDKRSGPRPHVIDIIAKAGCHLFLFERDGEATKGVTALFFQEFAKWFTQDEAKQQHIRAYFAEEAARWGQQVKDALRAGNAAQ